jgi:hypothetical protein
VAFFSVDVECFHLRETMVPNGNAVTIEDDPGPLFSEDTVILHPLESLLVMLIELFAASEEENVWVGGLFTCDKIGVAVDVFLGEVVHILLKVHIESHDMLLPRSGTTLVGNRRKDKVLHTSVISMDRENNYIGSVDAALEKPQAKCSRTHPHDSLRSVQYAVKHLRIFFYILFIRRVGFVNHDIITRTCTHRECNFFYHLFQAR